MTDAKGRGWFFTLDAAKLIAEFGEKTRDGLAEMHLALARGLRDDHEENAAPLTWMYRFFECAAVLLVVGIALWLVDLTSL